MPIAQVLHGAQRTDELSAGRLFGESEECVRRTSKRRDDDDRLAIEAVLDDRRDARDGVGVLDGGAAELADDHGRSIRPVAAINSAFSTDAPAAPRMIL